MEDEFKQQIMQGNDRQAVRTFRFLFHQFIQLSKLTPQSEEIIATGLVNMVALSELGRNEKNYIPDVNSMVNSLFVDSKILCRLQEMISAINQEFWQTANDILTAIQKDLKSQIFEKVQIKCSQFLQNKYERVLKMQQGKQGVVVNAKKIVEEVKEIVEKQQKVI